MVKGHKNVFKQAVDVDRDRDDAEGDDRKVPAHFRQAECFFFIFSEKEIKVGVEVDAEEDHKYRDDRLLQDGIAGDAVSQNTESSGTCCSEAEAKGIKERHSRNEQEYDLRDCDPQVDHVKDLCGIPDLGDELADDRSRALRAHQVHLTAHSAGAHGHDGEDKDDDAHAANPVGKASRTGSRG